jgi:hypothetical protein
MPDYPNLDSLIPITFFSALGSEDQENHKSYNCNHLGFLVKDGHNSSSKGSIQRIKCSACQKRFGSEATISELYTYQTQILQLIYDIFFARIPQTEIESRWHIPQSKISRFKKQLTTLIFQDPTTFSRSCNNNLPNGILMADETFMGVRGNSNTEINMINQHFETIAAGSAIQGQLMESIRKVYQQIPESDRKRLRVLITDGEPAYQFIPLEAGGRIIHLQQLHARKLLGKIVINKYTKFGPHYLHYIIKTHWKVFKQTDPIITLNWEIKFIKGQIQSGRGRPRKDQERSIALRIWRQKKDEYDLNTFMK